MRTINYRPVINSIQMKFLLDAIDKYKPADPLVEYELGKLARKLKAMMVREGDIADIDFKSASSINEATVEDKQRQIKKSAIELMLSSEITDSIFESIESDALKYAITITYQRKGKTLLSSMQAFKSDIVTYLNASTAEDVSKFIKLAGDNIQ